jgi:hypothetical protein
MIKLRIHTKAFEKEKMKAVRAGKSNPFAYATRVLERKNVPIFLKGHSKHSQEYYHKLGLQSVKRK